MAAVSCGGSGGARSLTARGEDFFGEWLGGVMVARLAVAYLGMCLGHHGGVAGSGHAMVHQRCYAGVESCSESPFSSSDVSVVLWWHDRPRFPWTLAGGTVVVLMAAIMRRRPNSAMVVRLVVPAVSLLCIEDEGVNLSLLGTSSMAHWVSFTS